MNNRMYIAGQSYKRICLHNFPRTTFVFGMGKDKRVAKPSGRPWVNPNYMARVTIFENRPGVGKTLFIATNRPEDSSAVQGATILINRWLSERADERYALES